MGGSDAPRGGGFFRGALTGLAVSAAALAAWSLSAPPAPRTPAQAPATEQREEPATQATAAPAPQPPAEPAAQPAQAAAERAPETPAEPPAAAPMAEPDALSAPAPAAAPAGEPNGERGAQLAQAAADRAPEPSAASVAEPPAAAPKAEPDAQRAPALAGAPTGDPEAQPAQAAADRAPEPSAASVAEPPAAAPKAEPDAQRAPALAGAPTRDPEALPAEAAADRAPEPPAASVAEPPAAARMGDPDAKPAQAAADDARTPPAAPEPLPAWRRNAEAFDARGAAQVAVALTGVDAGGLARALALGAPLTLVIDAAAPDASALIARARAAGREVVTLGADADPRAVGVAAPGFDADALARARDAGLLTLALTPGATTPPADGAAAFRLDGGASAARVFQTLQEAARRAASGDGVVVALAASDTALTGLARWLAVTQAAPAPLSAVATPPRT